MKYRLLLLLLVGVLMTGIVSAELQFDNVVRYEEPSLLKLDIKNTFGLGEVIGTVELKSHKSVTEVRKLWSYNSYQVAMYYDFTGWELYENGLGNIYFTDLKTGKDIDKQYYFAKWTEKEEIIYTPNNETGVPDESIRKYWEWEKYNSRDIPNTKTKTVRIALMVYVEKEDYTDGVWTLAGKRIKEHASWVITDGVNVGNLTQANFALGLFFKIDGTVLYDIETTTDSFHSYNCSTAWAVTSCTDAWGTLATGETSPRGMYYGDGGDRLYMASQDGDKLRQFNCSTSWSINSCVFDFEIPSQDAKPEDIHWKTDGTIMYELGIGNAYEYPCSDAWSIGSCNFNDGIAVGGGDTVHGINFKSDGSEFYIVDLDSDVVTQWDCSSAWDLSSCSDASITMPIMIATPFSLYFSPDGNNFYVGGLGDVNKVVQFQMAGGPTDDGPEVTLNSPIDYFNSSTSGITFNTTVIDDHIVQNVSLMINGLIDQTNTSQHNGTYVFNKALTTGVHNWSIWAFDNNSQANLSINRTVNITIVSPTINLYSPVDNFETTSLSNNFLGDVTDDFTIDNVSLFIGGVVDQTNTSGLKDVNYSFSKTFTEGTFTWKYRAYDNDSNPTDSPTRTIIIDATPPSLNISLPLNTTTFVDYAIVNLTPITYNWTASDPNLDICYLDNGTFFIVACNTNQSLSVPFGTYVYTFYANDTLNNTGSRIRTPTYKYKLFELNQSYENSTVEGNLEDYFAFINIDSSLTVSNVILDYDGTLNPASFSIRGNNIRLEKTGFSVPSVTSDENKTFFWNVTLSDGSFINLSSQNQTVVNLVFGNCSTYDYPLFNLTLVDEETQEAIGRVNDSSNGTIEVNVKFMNRLRTIFLFNWTEVFENNFTTSLCSSVPITATAFYSIDGTIKYFVDGSNAVEYYNLLNLSMTEGSTFQNITLRDLNLSDSTSFQLTFKDASSQPQENILIYVYREYVPENEFKVVEVPKTDSDGRTVVHLVRDDIIYNFIAVDIAGNTIGVLNNVVAFCKDFTIGQCTIDFIGLSAEQDLFNILEDVGIRYSLIFDNSTNVISLDFVSTTNTIKSVRLEAITSAIVTNRTACNETLSAITGVITCDVSGVVNSTSSVNIKIYVENELKIEDSLTFLQSTFDLKGILFFGFLLMLIMGIAFIESKEGIIISVILSMVVLISLGVVKGTIVGAVSSVLWLIIAGIILLIKLRKDN